MSPLRWIQCYVCCVAQYQRSQICLRGQSIQRTHKHLGLDNKHLGLDNKEENKEATSGSMDGWMSFVQNEQSIKQSIKMIIKVVRVVVIVNCDYPPSHTHTNKHRTLHKRVEGVYRWQVGCDGNVLVPPWCLNVHSNSPWWHVAVEIGYHAGGEGHIRQTALAVIATGTVKMQEVGEEGVKGH